jgi:hypothetical protein
LCKNRVGELASDLSDSAFYFIRISTSPCDPNNIRSIIDAQIQEPSVPLSAKNVNIVNSYALWETNRIQQYQVGLTNGMGNMITWWNDVYNGSTKAVNVSSFLSPWPLQALSHLPAVSTSPFKYV